jgi:hypothetical protein
MKEVLFNFDEFLDRLDGSRSKAHASYRRTDSGMFSTYVFRISFLESPSLVVVYEKSMTTEAFDDEGIRAFREGCRELAKMAADATPGYYEEDVLQ